MAAVVEADSTLVFKCMEFCQALASQGQVFNFSLSVGPSFSFSLDTTRSEAPRTKKKPSPSTLRRNARRRAEFNAKKQQSSPSRISSDDKAEPLLSPEMVNSKCLQIMCRGRRSSFLRKKVLLPLAKPLHLH